MAELLSHALLAFALFTAMGWAVSWLDREWVAVGMVGSLLPDLNRLALVVDDHLIEQVLGVAFDWDGLHTLGAVVVLSMVGAVVFSTRQERGRGFGLLLAGACSHLGIDMVKAWADGANGAYLFPFSWWRNPTPGLYVSADRWVLMVAVGIALIVFAIDQQRRGESATHP
jgi:membrane-bound metal-dependent hydrolase YbcI (DUF457 family)